MVNSQFGLFEGSRPRRESSKKNFDQLEATELYCPRCRSAVPVNKFLMLVLSDGDRYEYRCKFCGEKVGQKTDKSGQFCWNGITPKLI